MPYEAEGESFMRKRLLSITLVLLTLMTILLPAPMGVVREAEAESSTSGVEAKIKAVQAQLKKDFPTGFFTVSGACCTGDCQEKRQYACNNCEVGHIW